MSRENKGKWTRFFESRLFLAVGFILAVLVALGYARAYYQDYKIKQEISNLQAEVKKMEKKKLESMQILEYVTSPAFVEEKARVELNMKKPGENVIILQNQPLTEVESGSEAVEDAPLSNPRKWWYYFLHKTNNQ